MILSDKDIKKELEKEGGLYIGPNLDPRQIQPASVDLTLAHSYYYDDKEICAGTFFIKPGDLVLASTKEKIVLPDYLAGRFEGRSSWGRLGLLVHVSAGFIDPGFEGRITLEIVNLSSKPVTVCAGDRIGQLVLEELKTPCQHKYGDEVLGSKYQGQFLATPSEIRGRNGL